MTGRVKSDTLLTLSREPGPCRTCRHANQGTVDLAEGHLFCEVAPRHGPAPVGRDATCTQRLPDDESLRHLRGLWFYEPFTSANGTWGRLQDTRLLPPAASPELRAQMRADRPYIPADPT